MCGIAGLACFPGVRPDPALLQAMSDALVHRGPNGAGALDGEHAALRHRRLSIVDLEGGAQPLSDGAIALVANGEIYNDPALRKSLPDVRFQTGSDCESPLYLWPKFRAQYTRHLRGMYAIALLEQRGPEYELVLSRDPFGIKPLYYASYSGGIAFASEPRALLAAGIVPRQARPQARDQLLQAQFTTGAETIFPGIRRLLPGETLRIAGGHIVERLHQSALPALRPNVMTEEKALQELNRALLDSVSAHERADVPFGLFLSGGIDSAAILAAMARLDCGRPLAWTARFDAGDVDESAEAKRLAQAVGAQHRVLTIDEKMVWQDLPKIVAAMDDPAADYAIIPTWFLARAAREQATVILSGEGGDELFAGYGRYRRAMRPWWRGGRPPYRRGMFDGLGVLRRAGAWRDGLSMGRNASKLRAAQTLDIAEWLPNDLLLKLDRCLMAHSLEGRTPLLDPVVAEVAWNLPDDLKIRNGQGKYLLRRWLQDALPEARPFAPKQGFTVPIGAWIAAQGEPLGTLVAAQPCIAEIADPARVKALFRHAASRKQRHAAWAFLFYALWHRLHIENISDQGDVFETLSTSASSSRRNSCITI
ncbi:asparagine synthase (glutamine-hydrolyzing) [Kozakia baliensis]|uniref:asparagine synthase (glutamine-hydrolyzing) n=1 Tax=Kozakia baliensis TaxID=153496 RepID=A0A1D8US45_9PROT|nr:asparagine synthase (glutamine-hydrolyzing) [Kozakia baliensis]AOX16469.1 asparagine synthetase B [Kozakia baliensis]GBR29130.1 asparagine synthetase [Kozakia baliensis NRIC 0488]GEL63443.1 asparagine synthetase B [Kozakia baliensis]